MLGVGQDLRTTERTLQEEVVQFKESTVTLTRSLLVPLAAVAMPINVSRVAFMRLTLRFSGGCCRSVSRSVR